MNVRPTALLWLCGLAPGAAHVAVQRVQIRHPFRGQASEARCVEPGGSSAHPSQHGRSSAIAMVSPTVGDAVLIDELCALPGEERQGTVRKMVRAWADARASEAGTVAGWVERSRRADEFAKALVMEGNQVQRAAFEAHERGEDTSVAQARVETIVDMTVQIYFLVRELRKDDEGKLSNSRFYTGGKCGDCSSCDCHNRRRQELE